MNCNANDRYNAEHSYLKLPAMEKRAIEKMVQEKVDEYAVRINDDAQKNMLLMSLLALQMSGADRETMDMFLVQFRNISKSTRNINRQKDFDTWIGEHLSDCETFLPYVLKLCDAEHSKKYKETANELLPKGK